MKNNCIVVLGRNYSSVLGMVRAVSISNCDICKGTKDNNICLKCMLNYYLVNNKCKSYSFKATYKNTKINEEIELFNNTFLPNINAMYMNNS